MNVNHFLKLMAQLKKPSQGKATCLKLKLIPAHTGVTKIGMPSAMSRYTVNVACQHVGLKI